MSGNLGKYLRLFSSIAIRSAIFVGDAVRVVGDHDGSDDGKNDSLGLSEGIIDAEGSNDELGLLEGHADNDGASEGSDDESSDGCALGSSETWTNAQLSFVTSSHSLIVIAPNPLS